MPTYAFKCTRCDTIVEHFMGIGEYTRSPPTFVHCGKVMERHLEVVKGLAHYNALASERHYEGLRAQDGTPIDSRNKHREYMRRNNLTTIDDFALTWKKEARERAARMAGEDPQRKHDINAAIEKLGG